MLRKKRNVELMAAGIEFCSRKYLECSRNESAIHCSLGTEQKSVEEISDKEMTNSYNVSVPNEEEFNEKVSIRKKDHKLKEKYHPQRSRSLKEASASNTHGMHCESHLSKPHRSCTEFILKPSVLFQKESEIFEKLKYYRRNAVCEMRLEERLGLRLYLNLYLSKKNIDAITDY